ncbi:hypothetical protein BSKO_04293 [Bryopsis sp. KO-2023]|nr:hypothetical protein BSKO_04293 [Bryopsis sp. KO-2023]
MNVVEKARELSKAVIELREICLHSSSRWAAEQLEALQDGEPYRKAQQVGAREAMEGEEIDLDFLRARQFFEAREYRRAAHCLEDVPGDKPKFLRCYSMYLAGEKAREEASVEQESGLLDHGGAQNAELEGLEFDLAEMTAHRPCSPFLLYVYGLVLADRKRAEDARHAIIMSLNFYPCNWGAWQVLQGLCSSLEILHKLQLPNHWMNSFFMAAVSVELQHGQEGLKRLDMVESEFPHSTFVIAQRALAYYNLRNFVESQKLFEKLLNVDPCRLEGIDTYSNILYVKELAEDLSQLAHRAVMTDKYRPETCCIIGNYYSLKSSHDKALLYFKRALRLDSHFLSALTLMGHEYVEIQNCAAAIDAYRRAVDLNPKDFRAWYGLGQAYEMMQMPCFALHYFRRASQLRPEDARMWNAMGMCYQNPNIKKPDTAIRCFTRALQHGDQEGVSINFLARLYKESGQYVEAAHFFEQSLDRLERRNVQGKDAADALIYLAGYYKERGNLVKAREYCKRMSEFGGPMREKAEEILKSMETEGLARLQ